MRIAVLTNDYPPQSRGGAAVVAELQVRELERRGHEIRVFVSAPERTNASAFTRLFYHLADLRANEKLVADIMDWKPDTLLTHNLTGCGFGTPRRLKENGVRWIHMLHDVQLFEPSGQIIFGESHVMARRWWRGFWSIVRKAAMNEPDAVASPTSWLLQEHEHHGFFATTKKQVVPNPLDIKAEPDTQFVRDPKQILFVGRLDADKGVYILLQAWERVRHLASKLVLVGDGSRMTDLKARQDSNIEVRGSQPPEKVIQAMLESGVVVVPSLVMENQPTVILEALAACCRVVATDVGGVRETLGGAGWLVRPGSADDLARGIQEALTAPDDKARAARREEVLRPHAPESSVLRLMSLLKSNL